MFVNVSCSVDGCVSGFTAVFLVYSETYGVVLILLITFLTAHICIKVVVVVFLGHSVLIKWTIFVTEIAIFLRRIQ